MNEKCCGGGAGGGGGGPNQRELGDDESADVCWAEMTQLAAPECHLECISVVSIVSVARSRLLLRLHIRTSRLLTAWQPFRMLLRLF